jgi:5-azacytidine-induced protein 1
LRPWLHWYSVESDEFVQAQIRQLQEQMAVEKEVWQENYRKKQDAQLMQKERELQLQVKNNRDKDIENVMQQLLKENQAAIDDCEREAEKRIKCVFIFVSESYPFMCIVLAVQ